MWILLILEDVRLALEGEAETLDACRHESNDDTKLRTFRVRTHGQLMARRKKAYSDAPTRGDATQRNHHADNAGRKVIRRCTDDVRKAESGIEG